MRIQIIVPGLKYLVDKQSIPPLNSTKRVPKWKTIKWKDEWKMQAWKIIGRFRDGRKEITRKENIMMDEWKIPG